MGINSVAKTGCACSICGMGVSFEGCAGEGAREDWSPLSSIYLFLSSFFLVLFLPHLVVDGNCQKAVKFKTTNLPAIQVY